MKEIKEIEIEEVDEVLEEVKLFSKEKPVIMIDGIEKNPDVQCAEIEENVTLWNETDIRNDILRTVALAAFTGACAYFDLMAAALYIPLGIACLCNVCYKCGVYHGRNED